MSVAFRISCCLCRKNIPLAGDVIALDGEWQRRYPNMRGTLACERCVIDYGWNCCTTTEGGFVDGHVAAPEGEVDVDSWSHHLERGTHRALVQCHPRSGLLQGAEAYLRSVATRKGTDPEFAAMLRTVIQEWDEQHSGTSAPQPATV
ncbi:hypothetical protein PV736_35800 [Streptomyces scabiei]|uniref:hypothetical protein n=1 Tax=Streptomyces scabiei TaxID=1930 RepID=UPI0029ADE7F4|nr:hypothetical protein [Streptomyces scabiei]MDX3170282.1 hypothetical protein [Streptomyces scabiei]MDX3483220.1 hypothetical protein [Streptomyces scabiei]MDX3566271.1 hypothetical protein [Streptomyces scabiei]